MELRCYGRTYEASGDDVRTLTELLEKRQLALANRWRVGVTWPRGHRVRHSKVKSEIGKAHEIEVTLSCGGAILVRGDFDIGAIGHDERVLVAAMSDAIRAYRQACESAKAVDAVDPHVGDSSE